MRSALWRGGSGEHPLDQIHKRLEPRLALNKYLVNETRRKERKKKREGGREDRQTTDRGPFHWSPNLLLVTLLNSGVEPSQPSSIIHVIPGESRVTYRAPNASSSPSSHAYLLQLPHWAPACFWPSAHTLLPQGLCTCCVVCQKCSPKHLHCSLLQVFTQKSPSH